MLCCREFVTIHPSVPEQAPVLGLPLSSMALLEYSIIRSPLLWYLSTFGIFIMCYFYKISKVAHAIIDGYSVIICLMKTFTVAHHGVNTTTKYYRLRLINKMHYDVKFTISYPVFFPSQQFYYLWYKYVMSCFFI